MKKVFYLAFFLFFISGAFFLLEHKMKFRQYDFLAESIDGNVSMKSFDNEYKIVFFGYEFCPDVCPTSLALISSVLNGLNAKDVRVLFVTLDPKRDLLKDCDDYAKYFYKNSTCLRIDDKNRLDKMVKNYGSKYEIIDQNGSLMNYSIAHSSFIYLFDKKGRFIKKITNLTYDNVRKNIDSLLRSH